MQETINYIIEFLLADKQLAQHIAYLSEAECDNSDKKIVIIKSNFFDKDIFGTIKSMPQLPLDKLGELPILFGKPTIQYKQNQIIIHADFIASTFFLISRYEETINLKRDQHKRFAATDSIPYKAGFLNRCIIEEYGEFLKNCLQKLDIIAAKVQPQSQVYFTHDVDVPNLYRSCKSILGGIKRLEFKPLLKNIFKPLEKNIYYTFRWILRSNSLVANSKQIFFLRVADKKTGFAQDNALYSLKSNDGKKLIELLKSSNAQLGLHCSYSCGVNAGNISSEADSLKNILNQDIKFNRNHFLASLNPLDMLELVKANITDDFTMGYADCAGFRLGTCRAVKFIRPDNCELTELTLHPLSIMDTTLDSYMQLSENDAYKYCTDIIDKIKHFGGEIVLLWHNSSVLPNTYHYRLYEKIISYLR